MLRLFIAIPLTPDVAKAVAEALAAIKPDFPKNIGIRFVPEENWHFTLIFLGYQEETVIPKIKSLISPIGPIGPISPISPIGPIKIEFDKLTYGPPGGTPRMIWLTTTRATSEAFTELKKNLEDELEKNGITWRREHRLFQAHLTLARFEARRLSSLPPIEEDISIQFQAQALNLMQSILYREGAVYKAIFVQPLTCVKDKADEIDF